MLSIGGRGHCNTMVPERWWNDGCEETTCGGKAAKSGMVVSFGCVLLLHDGIGVGYKVLYQPVGCPVDLDTYPMAGAHIVGVGDEVVLLFERVDMLGLAFDGDEVEVVQVEVAEHVAAHIEHQHPVGSFESLERHFLFHIPAQ